MKNDLIGRVRSRKNEVRLQLPFDDIMEFAIALLTINPEELEALGWTFTDRKRFLDHFLASGRAAQGVKSEELSKMPIEIAVPKADLTCLQQFAVRELPKSASNAGMIDRVLRALDEAALQAKARKTLRQVTERR
ncbi:hypothetical protein WG901_08230 [Novosphingobium sp. PS1R-30]|uniref:Uncharacterized protein n=1 Tax=Novosphingobium anseongense TaxID=3133436 RepID=A0ABU8RU68_9SPHN